MLLQKGEKLEKKKEVAERRAMKKELRQIILERMDEDMGLPEVYRPIVALEDFVKKYKASEEKVMVALTEDKKQIEKELEQLDTEALEHGGILKDTRLMVKHLERRAEISARLDALLAGKEKRIVQGMQPLERSEAQDKLELEAQRAQRVRLDDGCYIQPDRWGQFISHTNFR